MILGGGEGATELLLPVNTLSPAPPRQGTASGAPLVCGILMFISLYSDVRKMKAIFCSLSFERIESLPVLK